MYMYVDQLIMFLLALGNAPPVMILLYCFK